MQKLLKFQGNTPHGTRDVWINPKWVAAMEEWSSPVSQRKDKHKKGLTRIIMTGGEEIWVTGKVSKQIINARDGGCNAL